MPKPIVALFQVNKVSSVDSQADGALKRDHIRPGQAMSVDHFESRLKGRTYTSFGKTTSKQYVGGCIFVDHMSGYIHVEHQLGLSVVESLRAKHNFEQMALQHNVLVQNYHADNGIFNKRKYVEHLQSQIQNIKYCGVGAYHQNGVAERSIRTVSDMSRAMLLHASMHWADGISSGLWPMAVDYAAFVHNRIPRSHGEAPIDLFTGQLSPRHKLKDLHVWGCPVYILDPKLQNGQKLPR